VVCPCDELCVDGRPSVFVRLDHTDDCVKATLIAPPVDLLQRMCAEPARFILSGVSCRITRTCPLA